MSGNDRFDYWLTQIWPRYEKLIELDKQEAKDNQQDSDSPQNDTGEQDNNPFSDAYTDYFDNRHPDPLSPEEHEKIHKTIKKLIKTNAARV